VKYESQHLHDPEMTPEDAERVLTAYRIGRSYAYQAVRVLDAAGVPRKRIQEISGMDAGHLCRVANKSS